MDLNTCKYTSSYIYTKVKRDLGTLLKIFCTSIKTFSKRRTTGDNVEKFNLRKRDSREVVVASKLSNMQKARSFAQSKSGGKGIKNLWKGDSDMKEEGHSLIVVLFLSRVNNVIYVTCSHVYKIWYVCAV